MRFDLHNSFHEAIKFEGKPINMNLFRQLVLLKRMPVLLIILSLFSCARIDVYEKNTSIQDQKWNYSQKPEFQFIISDTSVNYQLFVVLRHTDAYPFNNIWLNVGMQAPGDTMRYQRMELTLGNDAQGWEGTGMNDIWEVRKPITPGSVKLAKTGMYHFSLAQIMRQNPLPAILSAGIRVERVP